MLAVLRIIVLLPVFIMINLYVLVVCLVRPFHRDNVHIAGRAYAIMAGILGLKVILRVSDAIKKDEPYVYIANHQNSYDIITVAKAAQPGVVTVGKKSLKWIPIFGQIYWLSGNIMIDRKNSGKARDTLAAAGRKIKAKRTSVWLFPEGTRSNGRGLLPFKQGAFHLAKATGEPIVIVAASNLHNKIRWNRWNNGVMLIELMAPLTMSDEHTTKEWMAICHQQMADKIEALDAEVAELEKSR
ncbi:1-acylglycerol-3-phosphate O-acyltransferase [Alteromonas sp. CYL-A6]|uniref:1-acylglycerol-3-phosphate O-acyltransferase n=1 Tax=Alteromonas nitratireducens TaxID=3390813 RepID=UPI0034C48E5B